MEDHQIIALYWDRDEKAIEETASKYGRLCLRIAYNVLFDWEDAEESVNDTYLKTWEAIPPHRPDILSAFIGKITRRLAINKWRLKNRQKRGGGQAALALEELEDCVPTSQDVEQIIACKELTRTINGFLRELSETERDVFVSRYWYMASISEVSSRFGFQESKIKSMLFRTREKLKKYLEKEEIL